MSRPAFRIVFYPLFAIAIVLAFIAGAVFNNPEKPDNSNYSKKSNSSNISATSDLSLIEYVNQVRAANNVPPLTEDAGLNATAKIKGDDIAARNYWSHTDPDGVPFQVVMLRDRPGLQTYGENLAECFTTNKAAADAWVASPGHFKNMIDPRYAIIGSYSVWDQDKNCTIMVNHFGGLPQ